MRTDPFTRTPGIAGEAFINMHYADSIIESFRNPVSSKYVYKIVGLRGSGKSVEYSKIIELFSNENGWKVYTLSAAGNPTETLISKLSREKFADSTLHSSSLNVSAGAGGNVGFLNGNASISLTKGTEYNSLYYSAEASLSELVDKANNAGYRLLIGIDDISKSEAMVRFLSILGSLLLERKKIYLVCTGLSRSIEEFGDEPSLSFFKRSDSVEVSSLDKFEVAYMYRKLLNISEEESVQLAKFVRGYAYAYQVMGTLYFNKMENEQFDDLLPEFDKIMAQDSYDLIWKSLTETEQELVKIILRSEGGRVSDVKQQLRNPQSFDTLRNRLVKKHLVTNTERGRIAVNLPRFKEFVDLWVSD